MGRKKKEKRTPTVPQQRDYGTDRFQEMNKGNLRQEGKHKRLISQTPLDYYFRAKKTITHRQFTAGNSLYRDFRLAGLEPSLVPSTSLLEMAGGAGGNHFERKMLPTERQTHHRKEYRQALASMRNPTGAIMVVNVCVYGFFLRDFQINYYDNSTSMMPLFKESLDDLAEYYQIPGG